MDFDPTDDELFELDDDPSETPDTPDFRVTVQSAGTVRLVYWGPWLLSTGPAYTLLAARERARVAIADLRVLRDDAGLAAEVIVQFYAGGGEAHRRALCEWEQRGLPARLVRRRGHRARAHRRRHGADTVHRLRTALHRRPQRLVLEQRPSLRHLPGRMLALRLGPASVDARRAQRSGNQRRQGSPS
jgi:hypothetical protein